ncbi:MAG TPA: hypothetical protein VK404_18070 [Spirosoma sp.]|nr:hypothetical protein [Spirosoma sp.]
MNKIRRTKLSLQTALYMGMNINETGGYNESGGVNNSFGVSGVYRSYLYDTPILNRHIRIYPGVACPVDNSPIFDDKVIRLSIR